MIFLWWPFDGQTQTSHANSWNHKFSQVTLFSLSLFICGYLTALFVQHLYLTLEVLDYKILIFTHLSCVSLPWPTTQAGENHSYLF